MNQSTCSTLRFGIILRCWEDRDFADRFQRNPREAIAAIFRAEMEGTLSASEFEDLCASPIPPPPPGIDAGLNEEKLLLAFWEGVLEPE